MAPPTLEKKKKLVQWENKRGEGKRERVTERRRSNLQTDTLGCGKNTIRKTFKKTKLNELKKKPRRSSHPATDFFFFKFDVHVFGSSMMQNRCIDLAAHVNLIKQHKHTLRFFAQYNCYVHCIIWYILTVIFESSRAAMIAHKSNRTLLGLMYSDYRQLWLITILWGKRGSFAVFVQRTSNSGKGREPRASCCASRDAAGEL